MIHASILTNRTRESRPVPPAPHASHTPTCGGTRRGTGVGTPCMRSCTWRVAMHAARLLGCIAHCITFTTLERTCIPVPRGADQAPRYATIHQCNAALQPKHKVLIVFICYCVSPSHHAAGPRCPRWPSPRPRAHWPSSPAGRESYRAAREAPTCS